MCVRGSSCGRALPACIISRMTSQPPTRGLSRVGKLAEVLAEVPAEGESKALFASAVDPYRYNDSAVISAWRQQ
jgi:hypothetical protein